MVSIETTAFILGILAGVSFGLFWAYRILKKRQKSIPKDILEDFEKISKIKKEVQENGKENYKEESSKELKRGGREPRGFTDEQGRSLQYGDGERTPIIESRELNLPRTEPTEEQRSVSIQPTPKSKGDKPVNSGFKGDNKKRNKRNRFNPIE